MGTVDSLQMGRASMSVHDLFNDDPFFKSSRQEFEEMREKMMSEAEAAWKEFDNEVKKLEKIRNDVDASDRYFTETRREILEKATVENVGEFEEAPKQTLVEKIREQRRMMDLDSRGPDLRSIRSKPQTSSVCNEVIRVREDEKKMEVSLDTSQYRPDELSVSVSNGVITVEGKHEEKAEDGTKKVSRQFLRKYTLPAGAKPENVVSNLSSDGVLVITANKANPAIEAK